MHITTVSYTHLDVYKRQPLDSSIFAKVVLVKENDELVPLDGVESLEKVKAVRMEAKKKVFVTNAIRSLSKVSPTGNPRDIQFVVMVGGSALDVYKRQHKRSVKKKKSRKQKKA